MMHYPLVGLMVIAFAGWSYAEEKSLLGRKIDPFTLQDFRGKNCSLDQYKNAKLVVVAFVGTDCVLAKLYGPKLGKLAKEYEKKGVVFLGINSNSQDAVSAIAAYAHPRNRISDSQGSRQQGCRSVRSPAHPNRICAGCPANDSICGPDRRSIRHQRSAR